MTFIYIMEKFCIHFQRQNGFWLTVQVFHGFFSRAKWRQNRTAFFGCCHFCGGACWIKQCWNRTGAVTTTTTTAKHDKRCERASRIHLKNWERTTMAIFLSLCGLSFAESIANVRTVSGERDALSLSSNWEINGNDNHGGASCERKKYEKIIISRRRRRSRRRPWSCRKLFYKWKWCNIPQYRWTKNTFSYQWQKFISHICGSSALPAKWNDQRRKVSTRSIVDDNSGSWSTKRTMQTKLKCLRSWKKCNKNALQLSSHWNRLKAIYLCAFLIGSLPFFFFHWKCCRSQTTQNIYI